MLPKLEARGIHTQIVTSAFRVIPVAWNKLTRLNIVVSIDGLQADHDERRKPATYDRILNNIAGTKVTIHSTITGNIAARPGYLEEFLKFWSTRPEINKYGLVSLRHSAALSVRRFSLLNSDRSLLRIF